MPRFRPEGVLLLLGAERNPSGELHLVTYLHTKKNALSDSARQTDQMYHVQLVTRIDPI